MENAESDATQVTVVVCMYRHFLIEGKELSFNLGVRYINPVLLTSNRLGCYMVRA